MDTVRPARKLLSETGISLTVSFRKVAFVLTAILNLRKVDRSQPAVPVNSSLLGLYEIASSPELKEDPWILFLYGNFRRACDASTHRVHVSRGLLLYRLNRRDAAIECALLSLQRYLWNWSAWDLLSNLINDGEEVGSWCHQLLSFCLSPF